MLFLFRSLFLFLFLVPFLAIGQQYTITNYSERDGLPNTVFKAVAKDSLGFIWISSDAGLIRFDGQRFTQYRENLPSVYIKYFLKTKSNRLFASTDNGVVEIKAQRDTAYIELFVKGGDKYEKSRIVYPKSLFEDSKGRIWIAGESAVAIREHNYLKYYHFKRKDRPNSYYHSFSVLEDGYGHLLVFSQPGSLFRLDEDRDKMVQYDLQLHSTVESAVLLKKGLVAVGGSNGLQLISFAPDGSITGVQKIDNHNFAHVVKANDNKILAASWSDGLFWAVPNKNGTYTVQRESINDVKDINHIYYSDQHNIWIASDNGVQLLRPAFFTSNVQGLNRFYVQTVSALSDGYIYTSLGDQIWRAAVSDSTFRFKKYTNNLKQGHILHFAQTDSFTVVSTGDGKLVYLRNGKTYKVVSLSSYGRSVFRLFTDSKNNIWACQDGCGGIIRVSEKFEVEVLGKENGLNKHLYGGIEYDDGRLIAFGGGMDFIYLWNEQNQQFTSITDTIGLSIDKQGIEIMDYAPMPDKTYVLGTSDGVLKLHPDDKLSRVNVGMYDHVLVRAIAADENSNIWLANEQGLLKVSSEEEVSLFQTHNGLRNSNIPYRCISVDKNNNLWIGTSEGLSVSFQNQKAKRTPTPLISSLFVNGKKHRVNKRIMSGSYAEFVLSCLAFPSENILFQTRMLPQQKQWKTISKSNHLFLPKLETGSYELQVRAKQDGNHTWSETISYSYLVEQYWYLSWWAYLLYALLAGISIHITVRLYVFRLKKQKKRLEEIVTERTEALVEKQKDLEVKNVKITEQNEKIRSSIQYAKTIQGAILPLEERLKLSFDHFVIFRPKDIVSGDFYWFWKQDENTVFVSTIDCSGHGVPGAFMSMIAYSLINEIVKVRKLTEPAEILSELNKSVHEALKQEFTDNKDGMDMAMVRIDNLPDKKRKIVFSAARNKLYHFATTSKELSIYKGDRHSIGGNKHAIHKVVFTQKELTLPYGDIIYLLSDGYIDQHSSSRQRFGSKRFIELLNRIGAQPLSQQKQELELALDAYQKNESQRDDITVLGLRIGSS